MTHLSHLECPRCGEEYDPGQLQNLCACGSPLLVRYDLDSIGRSVDREELESGRGDMWRFREFLPVPEEEIVSLGEGMTPIFPLPGAGSAIGASALSLKDEGFNPTGTFKARGASCGVSMARHLGVTTVAMPTAGNAGGAWSAYAARAGMDCVVAMPQDAPLLAQQECSLFGAATYLVRGLISDAGAIIGRACRRYGWFDVSTLKEPYRIEGKKTMGLELAQQLGWRVPDAVVYPAGGGVGLIGIWKALEELEAIGWIGPERPRMIAVQSEGCAPLVRAFEEGRRDSDFWEGAETLAGGIRVPKALGDFLVLDALYASGGRAAAVSDEQILEAMRLVAGTEGLFMCPEGAACVAAVSDLIDDGFLDSSDEILIINTGTGLKYSEVVDVDLPTLDVDEDIVVDG
ncbi:MAG: threonine synthase, partial [Bacillota bacterium]